jgi:hypothetical protein
VLARHAPPISRSCANLDIFSSSQSTRRRGVSKSLGELNTRAESLPAQRTGVTAMPPASDILLHCGK